MQQIKTPISYYGGKQSMLKEILPRIPDHDIYVEPFFGGGAVFWAKEPVRCEVINDVNGNITNFYEVLKHDFFKLREKIEVTLHSRDIYKKALVIYEMPWLFQDDRTIRAWAFWVVTDPVLQLRSVLGVIVETNDQQRPLPIRLKPSRKY